MAKLGYVHSPRKAKTAKTAESTIPNASSDSDEDHSSTEEYHGSSDDDESSSDDHTVQDENNPGPSPDPALPSPANNHDNVIDALGANKFGIISRRLFSNVGANKQLAAGAGSHKVSSKDTVSIVRIPLTTSYTC